MTSEARKIFSVVGKTMDIDDGLDVFGRPGTESISHLHKKPCTYEDIAMAIYERIRASGIEVKLEYHPEEVDIEEILRAREIRLEAQKERDER